MSRPLRIEFKNAWYHVMNRGARAQDVFLHNKHRKIFLSLLADITKIYSIEIHAYCLMNNHYHLLIKTPLGNLSNAMRHLNSVYTQRFNKTEKCDGSLFRGRYKSIVISGFKYLLSVSRYIHLNPVKANLVKYPEDYRWSSCKNYLKKTIKEECLYTEKILSYFKKQNHRIKYKTFVHQGMAHDDLEELYQDTHLPLVLGDERAKIIIQRITKQSLYTTEIAAVPRICHRYNLVNLRTLIAHYYNINIVAFHRKYYRQMTLYKYLFMYIARYFCKYKLREIASFIGNIKYCHVSTAIAQFKTLLRKNKCLQKDVAHIVNLINNQLN